MPKASCDYQSRKEEYIICRLTGEPCGHVKYCRAERRWKIHESAVNCTIPKKVKEGKQ